MGHFRNSENSRGGAHTDAGRVRNQVTCDRFTQRTNDLLGKGDELPLELEPYSRHPSFAQEALGTSLALKDILGHTTQNLSVEIDGGIEDGQGSLLFEQAYIPRSQGLPKFGQTRTPTEVKTIPKRSLHESAKYLGWKFNETLCDAYHLMHKRRSYG